MIAEGIAKNDLSALKATHDLELLSQEGKKELTLMWFAADNVRPNFEAIRVLVEKGVDPTTQGLRPFGSMLYYSLKQKDLRYLTALLDGGFPVNYQSERKRGGSPLIQLASGPHGSLAHVKLLVERGADIHLRDRLGYNAFNDAISARNFDTADYLLELGTDLTSINYNGVTTAWGVQFTLSRLDPALEHHAKLSRIQQKMIEKGIEFPAKPPAEVKEWMRSQGMYVIGDD